MQKEYKMSVTIKDIAKIAGVSHSTVSRSLNDSPLISTETKEKIKKIAWEMGFEFNANARGLITKKTGTIALIYPEDFEKFNINLFFGSLQSDIRKTLEREGLDVIVAFPKNRFTGESNIQQLINRKKVDGFVIVHSQIDHYDLSYLKDSQIPFVFLHHKPNDNIVDEADFYYTDHFKGGYLAAEHLIQLGYRHIICITNDGEEFVMRLEGYKAALQDYGFEVEEQLIFQGDFTFKSGYDIVKQNHRLIRKSGAIFAQSDLMALGAIEALKQLNIQVPGEVAVVGYDNIELGSYFSPTLTTIHQPREELAALACERLVNLLSCQKRQTNVVKAIPPVLVIRKSCGSRG